MALTMDQLNAAYEKAKFSNTAPVGFEDMNIYRNTVVPQNVNIPSGLNITNIAPVTEAQSVTQSNGLDYLLNQGGDDNNYVNKNINYDNLKIPTLQSEKRNKLSSGIIKAFNIIKDPITGLISSAIGMLPDRDSRQGTLENFYGDNFGLTSSGSVASGIMQGYNPVSGFGDKTQYGLTSAIDKRIDKIKKTMLSKIKRYGSTYDSSKQLDKIKQLRAVKEKEAAAFEQAQRAREATTAARAIARNPQVYRDAGVGSGGFASQNTGTNPNFSNKTGRGRTGYGTGGIVTL